VSSSIRFEISWPCSWSDDLDPETRVTSLGVRTDGNSEMPYLPPRNAADTQVNPSLAGAFFSHSWSDDLDPTPRRAPLTGDAAADVADHEPARRASSR
jgi:hypothetical protein